MEMRAYFSLEAGLRIFDVGQIWNDTKNVCMDLAPG
jgi:hypothetical protein